MSVEYAYDAGSVRKYRALGRLAIFAGRSKWEPWNPKDIKRRDVATTSSRKYRDRASSAKGETDYEAELSDDGSIRFAGVVKGGRYSVSTRNIKMDDRRRKVIVTWTPDDNGQPLSGNRLNVSAYVEGWTPADEVKVWTNRQGRINAELVEVDYSDSTASIRSQLGHELRGAFGADRKHKDRFQTKGDHR